MNIHSVIKDWLKKGKKHETGHLIVSQINPSIASNISKYNPSPRQAALLKSTVMAYYDPYQAVDKEVTEDKEIIAAVKTNTAATHSIDSVNHDNSPDQERFYQTYVKPLFAEMSYYHGQMCSSDNDERRYYWVCKIMSLREEIERRQQLKRDNILNEPTEKQAIDLKKALANNSSNISKWKKRIQDPARSSRRDKDLAQLQKHEAIRARLINERDN